MTSSESEEQAPRKRTRTRNSDDDGIAGGKKARGRPRVATQDATAADRRRTQIRLAQRAYRQRKETTIASLKNQNSQLCSVIEQMNTTFSRLTESVVKSGLLQLNSELAQEFQNVTYTISSLVKTASKSEDKGNDEQMEAADDLKECHEERSRHTPTETESHLGWGYSVPISSAQPQPHSVEQPHTCNSVSNFNSTFGQDVATSNLVRHRQSTIGDILDQQRVSLPQRQSVETSSRSQQLPFGFLDLLSQQQASYTPSNSNIQDRSVTIPTPDRTPPMMRLTTPQLQYSLSTKMTGTRTYSFEETNFARRLTRRALETGFQILSATNVRPAVLNHVFRLSLPFLTPDQLRTRFKLMLSRGPGEDLDWWETPFIQLGGAGTHYPKRDAVGRIIPFKNAWKIRPPGPLDEKFTQLEHAVDGRIESLNGVDLSGFEGEWFDAHDVQGYLEDEYACKLDPHSSFAECLVDDDDSRSTSDQNDLSPRFAPNTQRASHERGSPGLISSSGASSTSSVSLTSAKLPPRMSSQEIPALSQFGLTTNYTLEPTPTNRGGNFQKPMDYDISFDQTLGLDLAPGFDYGFSSNNGMDITSAELRLDVMSNNMLSAPRVRQKGKRIVTVDVSRLIDEMIRHGVCLGRAPGFRRKDVDAAVRTAAISTC